MSPITTAGILLLVLLSGAIIFFITEWLRADLVALLLLVALGVTGILTLQETLSGFSRSAVITIMAIYILTAGLAKTGATRVLGARLMRLGGHGERYRHLPGDDQRLFQSDSRAGID